MAGVTGVFCLALLGAGAVVAAQQTQPQRSEIEKAVEEFKTLTRNLGLRGDSPRRQRQNGSKGQWHGRLFENFRNDFLDAVPHEVAQRGGDKSTLRRNQFGFNITGPVVIPRLFHGGRRTYFSLSYEGVRERISRSYLRTIPTLEERTGDWRHVVDQAGNPLPIFDPQTTRRNPGFDPARPVSLDNLEYQRAPFPDDRIPAHRLEPVAQRALTFYPAPNTDVGPFFRNNYFIHSPETNVANGIIAKLDHSLRERHRLSFGLSYSNGLLGSAKWFSSAANPGPVDREFRDRSGSLEHIFTVSPRTVNTLSFETSSDGSESGAANRRSYAAELGLGGSLGQSFPLFSVQPYLSMGRSYPISKNVRNTYIWTNAFSTRRGKHGFRVVGRYVHYQVNTFWPQYPSGRFRFSEGLTSLPGIVNTGHAFASFLLGLSDFAELSLVESPSYFRRESALLALRHQYEVTEHLNLNLGVNLDVNTPRVEKYDRQSTVDLQEPNPANGRLGALVAAGQQGRPRGFQPTRVRLEPSASLSWNPLGDARTVLRLAFSRSYAATPIYFGQWATQGFNGTPTFISPNVQRDAAVRLSEGVPPTANPLPDLRPEAANDTVADLMDRTNRQPTYQSASLSIEREVPGSMVVTIGAAYSGGKNLLVSNYAANPNAVALDALRYRDRLNDEAFNRSLRPYPQYKGFDVYSSYPAGKYERDAGFVRVEKRASQGLTISGYYEFSKQMDDYSGPYGTQDYFNRHNEWSLTAGNHPQRFSLTAVYELPVGPNRPLFNATDWRRHLTAGWSASAISSLYSGEPLALRPQFNNTGGIVQALRVNVVPGVDPHADDPSPDRWFNPAAFDQPPDFTIGNASRTHPSLRAPRTQNHDLSLTKRFALAADRSVEFTAVALNFLNHGNWNDPDVEIGPAQAPNVNAGRIIGSRGGRVIQLGLRLSF